MNTFLHDLPDYGAGNWCPDCGEPRGVCQCDDDATQEIVTLPTLPDDPTPTVTMTDGKQIVATVRTGSIVYRLMLARGYRVFKS